MAEQGSRAERLSVAERVLIGFCESQGEQVDTTDLADALSTLLLLGGGSCQNLNEFIANHDIEDLGKKYVSSFERCKKPSLTMK
eukprot:scaffold1416_cov142-Skeletonema_menzelii.AAC.2